MILLFLKTIIPVKKRVVLNGSATEYTKHHFLTMEEGAGKRSSLVIEFIFKCKSIKPRSNE